MSFKRIYQKLSEIFYSPVMIRIKICQFLYSYLFDEHALYKALK